jgi:poly-gamma-glutamate synthesis protein (capsule biosynthesis protein)
MPTDDQPLLLLSSLGRTVYAMTQRGEVAWQLRTGSSVYALTTLAGGRAVAGEDAGLVTMFDSAGGTLWQYDLGSRVTSLSDGWQDGVLAGSWGKGISLLGEDGTLRWQVATDGPASGIVTLAQFAVVATLHGQVLALSSGGSELWRFDAASPVTSLDALRQGSDAIVLASLQDGRLVALGQDGSLIWQRSLAEGGPVWHVLGEVEGGHPQIVAGSGGPTPSLVSLSTDGLGLWRVSLPAPVGAVTSLDLDNNGTPEILAGLTSGEILAFDEQGQLRGSAHGGLSIWELMPAGAGSAVVLADVVAWQLAAGTGRSGSPWLSPPEMLPALLERLPAATERSPDEAILVFLGDVGLGRSMERQLARYGPTHPWEAIRPLLDEADLTVANLEGVLTARGEPLNKSYLIRAHPDWGQALVEGGLDLVTLANNHALDFGSGGLDDTGATLRALDIAVVGAGPSRQAAHRPALYDVKGMGVAILGYAAARWNGSVDVPATDRLAWAEPRAVQADVQAIRDQVDLVVVLLHAGTEYATTPSPDQIAFAHAAIDAGADLVVGHHPHVTQTVERYRQGLVIYSLGDALFDIPRQAAMQGELLRVHATREGLAQVELWPFWIEDAIRLRLLDDGEGQPRFRIIYP